jgi:hypothetical protein
MGFTFAGVQAHCPTSQNDGGTVMRAIFTAIVISLYATGAFAQDTTCKSQAADKKLAGAALNSFMKKCQRDATSTCSASAAEKKLAGAAKNSFTKKCVSDAVGT